MTQLQVTRVRATTLSPLHYHSVAVPSGTATISAFLADRSMSYALAGAMGALAASPALKVKKDYHRDLALMPWLCSVFETSTPRLLKPIGKRLNLDAEGGYQKKIADATGSGNLKTWFYIQEIPAEQVFEGAIFGPDPFLYASAVEKREVSEIVVRTGRHLGGIVRLERLTPEPETRVRLNVHTAFLFGADVDNDPRFGVDVFALHDMQFTSPMLLGEAQELVGSWRKF